MKHPAKEATPDLFDQAAETARQATAPLADRLRPRTLEEFVGQEALVGSGTVLRGALEQDQLFSLILWGPPGSGKTTLARLIAQLTKSFFVQLSAVTSGVAELRQVMAAARERQKFQRQRTILFVDEIHRWSKSQQDALLPHVEDGTIVLIGATTENPSFEVIAPLLSRARVLVLERLTNDQLDAVLQRALHDTERGLGTYHLELEAAARELLIQVANGDARILLNAIEIAAKATPLQKGKRMVTLVTMEQALQHKALLYDKAGEEHYNVISAFIKSMRGSSIDGALYWLARMLEAGEDPLFIARRMVIFASEDVGLADAQALPLAVAVFQAVERVGLPEGRIPLGHCAAYLARAPKDNSAYVGLGRASAEVQRTLNEPVPLNLRNAPTDLMKDLDYGKGYKYSHDYESGSAEAEQDYLPKSLQGKKFYTPKDENAGTA
jgi:putative ATPase